MKLSIYLHIVLRLIFSRATPPLPHVPLWRPKGQPHTLVSMYIFVDFEVQGPVHRKYVPKYNQQDATLHSLFISVNCSTCFGWIPHPSSGAQNCIYSIWYLLNRYCYHGRVETAGSSNGLTNTRCCRYSFVLLMMGGGST